MSLNYNFFTLTIHKIGQIHNTIRHYNKESWNVDTLNKTGENLTTSPDIHWFAIGVLSQDFRGEVSRSACKTCKAIM